MEARGNSGDNVESLILELADGAADLRPLQFLKLPPQASLPHHLLRLSFFHTSLNPSLEILASIFGWHYTRSNCCQFV